MYGECGYTSPAEFELAPIMVYAVGSHIKIDGNGYNKGDLIFHKQIEWCDTIVYEVHGSVKTLVIYIGYKEIIVLSDASVTAEESFAACISSS